MTLEEMFDANGYDVEKVGDEERYVTRDQYGRAKVGPRRRGTRGVMALLHRRHRPVSAPPQTEAEPTIVLPRAWEADTAITSAVRPSERPNLRERVRHAAVDIAIVAISLSGAAIALKAAWMVVTL